LAIKEKLAQQKKHIEELEKHMYVKLRFPARRHWKTWKLTKLQR
jgi:hypothetical protein